MNETIRTSDVFSCYISYQSPCILERILRLFVCILHSGYNRFTIPMRGLRFVPFKAYELSKFLLKGESNILFQNDTKIKVRMN